MNNSASNCPIFAQILYVDALWSVKTQERLECTFDQNQDGKPKF